MVKTLWFNYDVDRSGFLDISETKQFVKDVLHAVHRPFKEPAFYQQFRDMDSNGDGLISE
jgi:hypothetical protein